MTKVVNNLIYRRFLEQNPQYSSGDIAFVFTCTIRVGFICITYILNGNGIFLFVAQ